MEQTEQKQIDVLNGYISSQFDQLRQIKEVYKQTLHSLSQTDVLELLKQKAANNAPSFELTAGEYRVVLDGKVVSNVRIEFDSLMPKVVVTLFQSDEQRTFEFQTDELNFYEQEKEYFDLFHQMQQTKIELRNYLSL